MFRKHGDAVYIDLSLELRDPDDWRIGPLRTLDIPLNVTTMATEPISGLLAVGTAGGVVYVFGGPGVETRLPLPESVGVKFLQFATSTFQLVCLDDRNMMHIWDLASYGRPKFVLSVRFDPTNSLTLSPSHSHAFLALNSGEIRTYDLTCLRKSPYTMPNMWRLYEDKLFAGGIPNHSSPDARISVDTVIHPRDLNQLFVAYAGGIILSDLTERSTIRSYELVLPPGAPGGFGYGSHDLLTHRKAEVTTLAIHPAGHFFAVGYTDGSIAFWAVNDDESPLLVRTLDAIDVNVVDTEQLDQHVLQEKAGKLGPIPEREPIFKLSWSGFSNSSDPRGGKTTLAILGGLCLGEPAGLTVIQLPAFNPPEPPSLTSPTTENSLHPFMRAAMRDSLDPLESHFYLTQGVVHDYLLIPRQTPHFAGTFDPVAILLLIEGPGDTRIIEAFQYPPPEFSSSEADATKIPPEGGRDALNSLADDLASTLQSLQQSGEPQHLRLPTTLSDGSTGLLDGQLLKLERETYQTLIGDNSPNNLSLPLKGGLAWSDEAKVNDLKLAKYQPHRILITHHRDFTVQFYDISAQLLIGLQPTPMQHSFPHLLHDLLIDLKPVFTDAFVTRRISPAYLDHARIESVHFAAEALETVAVMKTGEVLVYRLSGPRQSTRYRESSDEELIVLDHVPSQRGFSPYLMLAPGRGPVEACALSDIGFVAVAYHNALFVINMRGPKIVFRHIEEKPSKKHAIGVNTIRTESDPISSLLWTVSPIAKDPESRVRLIVLRASGHYQIFTLAQSESSSSWICAGPVSADGAAANPLPRGSFVIDGKSGAGWPASRTRYAVALSGTPASGTPPSCIFVTTGAKGARCFANINGERVGKADWGSKIGTIQAVQIIEKLGSHVLVVVTDRHEGFVYSLPHLEYLQTLRLPPIPSSSFTLDETGDFVAWTPHPSSGTIHQATYGTLFDIRRVYDQPDIDFLCTKPVIPPQPQPVSMGPPSMLSLGSWFPFNQSMTGAQLDELLGGPDRPSPEPHVQSRDSSEDNVAGVSGIAAAASSTQSNLYNRLASALNERGQILGDLEDRFNALEEGSKNMVSQAKKLATQQTARSWFGL
ncbi:Uncharacterized protein C1F3.03 [Hypsizygus marmoreus]|uniref:Uncharacterized protein C1F3.03 n=1 Tax=Hypsizygus marmoreus TaxID=39966 RepID=A0A369K7R7_HYPMA|nr:Uncharacterized protein C1F3.03 [Hypsizygus marmoreus]